MSRLISFVLADSSCLPREESENCKMKNSWFSFALRIGQQFHMLPYHILDFINKNDAKNFVLTERISMESQYNRIYMLYFEIICYLPNN